MFLPIAIIIQIDKDSGGEEDGAVHLSDEVEIDHEKVQDAEISAILRARWVGHCNEYFTNFFKQQAAKNSKYCMPEINIVLKPWFEWVGYRRV
jgi:hypothetical protein